MVEHLVKDPNKLYEICSYRDLEEYYPFSFIGNFNSIEVDIYYDVLNTMDSRILRNIYGYIVKQWTIIQKHIELSDYSDVSKKKYMNKKRLFKGGFTWKTSENGKKLLSRLDKVTTDILNDNQVANERLEGLLSSLGVQKLDDDAARDIHEKILSAIDRAPWSKTADTFNALYIGMIEQLEY